MAFDAQATLGERIHPVARSIERRAARVALGQGQKALCVRYYNYTTTKFPVEEATGISVFYQEEEDEIFHTYSCYARGLDMLNGAYHYLGPQGP